MIIRIGHVLTFSALKLYRIIIFYIEELNIIMIKLGVFSSSFFLRFQEEKNPYFASSTSYYIGH